MPRLGAPSTRSPSSGRSPARSPRQDVPAGGKGGTPFCSTIASGSPIILETATVNRDDEAGRNVDRETRGEKLLNHGRSEFERMLRSLLKSFTSAAGDRPRGRTGGTARAQYGYGWGGYGGGARPSRETSRRGRVTWPPARASTTSRPPWPDRSTPTPRCAGTSTSSSRSWRPTGDTSRGWPRSDLGNARTRARSRSPPQRPEPRHRQQGHGADVAYDEINDPRVYAGLPLRPRSRSAARPSATSISVRRRGLSTSIHQITQGRASPEDAPNSPTPARRVEGTGGGDPQEDRRGREPRPRRPQEGDHAIVEAALARVKQVYPAEQAATGTGREIPQRTARASPVDEAAGNPTSCSPASRNDRTRPSVNSCRSCRRSTSGSARPQRPARRRCTRHSTRNSWRSVRRSPPRSPAARPLRRTRRRPRTPVSSSPTRAPGRRNPGPLRPSPPPAPAVPHRGSAAAEAEPAPSERVSPAPVGRRVRFSGRRSRAFAAGRRSRVAPARRKPGRRCRPQVWYVPR